MTDSCSQGCMPSDPNKNLASVDERQAGLHLQGSESTVAEAFAYAAHRGQHDGDGRPYIDHVRRVAEMVPDEYKPVAWLHDVLEDTDVKVSDLYPLLSAVEIGAVLLLTRNPQDTYDQYISVVAKAEAPMGDIARAVKEADLLDNLARCKKAGHSLESRYRRALAIFLRQ